MVMRHFHIVQDMAGTEMRDNDCGEEDDGHDEASAPHDFKTAGMMGDDDSCGILIEDLPDGVHLASSMDCCHSGIRNHNLCAMQLVACCLQAGT